MNNTKIIIIDSDNLGIQPAVDTLQQDYETLLINNIDQLDIASLVAPENLFIIDPNSFQRRALSIYKRLLQIGASVIVIVYPDESIVSEAECLNQGALDFLIKPISPTVLHAYVSRRMKFIQNIRRKGLSTKRFISNRQAFSQSIDKELVIDLVEDSSQDAHTLFNILQPEVEFRWFNSANKFIQRDTSIVPDLFILDIVLEGHPEGYELYNSIASHPDFNHIPILFLTGSWQRRKVEKGLQLGATDYIRKAGADEAAIRARIHTNLMFSVLAQNGSPISEVC